MLAHLRSSLTYANVMATVAVFVALGGTSYAVATGSIDSREIKNNTVRSADIRNAQVSTSDLRNNSATGTDLRNDTLTGDDVLESALGEVPRASQAATAQTAVTAQSATSATSATTAGSADTLDALDSTAFLRLDPGTTLRGAWRVDDDGDRSTVIEVVGFPVPAAPLPVQNVNFGPDPQANDDDPECSGTVAVPTAPPGKVCLYRSTSMNATLSGGTSQSASFLTFAVVGIQVAAGEYSAIGSWAYTVP